MNLQLPASIVSLVVSIVLGGFTALLWNGYFRAVGHEVAVRGGYGGSFGAFNFAMQTTPILFPMVVGLFILLDYKQTH